jgi:hypothetical protein
MTNTGPFWTDYTAVQAPYALLKGGVPLRTTAGLDLRSKFGGMLKIAVGRYSTAALNVGMDVIVRRTLSNDGAAHAYSAPLFSVMDGTAYNYQLINYASNYAAGVQSIAFDTQAGSFAHGDGLCFWGQTSIPGQAGALSFASGVNMEILRCSAGTATPLIPDAPTKFAHNDNEYFTLADSWEVWLPGGATYALVFDPGAVTTASGVFAVMADIQTFDKLTKVS